MKPPLISKQEHQRVLAQAVDVPEEQPAVAMPLTAVGITNKCVWVRLNDPDWGRLAFTAAIHVNLSATRRGIHMSRLEQAISDLHEREFPDLPSYVMQLGRKVLSNQHATTAGIDLIGRVPLLRRTPVSDRLSIDNAEIRTTACLRQHNDAALAGRISNSVNLCHMTACPCTISYNRMLFQQPADAPCPAATHSQRAMTTLAIETTTSQPTPSHRELIDCLARALHLSRDLLKRPDEAELVLQAHRAPQFAEDVVRQVGRSVGNQFARKLPAESTVRIDSVSLESIHMHDVHCYLETTMAELDGL